MGRGALAQPNRTFGDTCVNGSRLEPGQSPTISALMFSAGVLGNLLALALLEGRRRRSRAPTSLFHVLVTGLVVTDLLGTCLISPVVLLSYGRDLTLLALAGGRGLCHYFAYAMTFFSLATLLLLFAMALERCLAIGHPYLYERMVTRRSGLVAFPLLYAFCFVFCSFPVLGIGEYVQYCPGTWCFINIKHGDKASLATGFSLVYATLLLALIVSVLVCNLVVITNLVLMHRRQKTRRLGSLTGSRKHRVSMSEETDHLILLSLMTIIFVICSLPFTIRVYVNKIYHEDNYKLDLLALRFLSLNSIIDPWVFTILRPSVLRLMRSALCCQCSLRKEDTMQTVSVARQIATRKLTSMDSGYGSSHKRHLEELNNLDRQDNVEI
ncbi:prostaglandin E2 receptor EP2 subtype-like [Rhinatrema bivittatum]|uniref:prostaglandin E2 receptor EP2 subtype-like n=1 Tax=Rhinatrema bivittatum TaxID=194408 RepID=UPI001128BFD2|nr:prostaglandin E2 receptor EP2 subtype-like [Rhinatrema bivittatum]